MSARGGERCTHEQPTMDFSASDAVPFTQARSNLSELAKAGAEKIITKNGESCVALIDADRLDYYHRLERERIHLLLIDDVKRGLADIAAGRSFEADREKSPSYRSAAPQSPRHLARQTLGHPQRPQTPSTGCLSGTTGSFRLISLDYGRREMETEGIVLQTLLHRLRCNSVEQACDKSADYSLQPNRPDVQREAARLTTRNHEAHLAYSGGIECGRTGYGAAPEGGAERLQRKTNRMPRVCWWRELGLVALRVKRIIGKQAQFEVPAVASGVDHAIDGTGQAERPCLAAHRGKAAVLRQRDLALEDGVAIGVVAESAVRDAAHDTVVDGVPALNSAAVAEVK